jgi:hypothetical protein
VPGAGDKTRTNDHVEPFKDQGDNTHAPVVALGAPGGLKAWGRMTVSGPVTARTTDAKRRSFMGKVVPSSMDAASVGTLCVGGSGATSADGQRYVGGEGFVLDRSTDAIGFDALGGTVKVDWLEERNE